MADDDPEFAYLTTVGRRSGAPHTVELWYRRIGETVWFLAGQASDWIANAEANAHVTVRIGDGPSMAGVARVAPLDDVDARRLMATRYQGWREGRPMSAWALTATALAVDLQGGP